MKLFKLVLRWFYRIRFEVMTQHYGIDPSYIRNLYARLIDLDTEDFVDIGRYQFTAFASTVHIIEKGCRDFSINENEKGILYIHEKPSTREFWDPDDEVYRLNKTCRLGGFYLSLKDFEKELDNYAIQESKTKSVPIQSAPSNSEGVPTAYSHGFIANDSAKPKRKPKSNAKRRSTRTTKPKQK